MAGEHEVIVYSTPTCPWCSRAKAYLTQLGVPYEDKDVSRDVEAAREMVRISGQMGVPVLVIDGNVVVGFDKPRIDELLKK
ncbi:MAG: glutaredoxin family protein [Firmicutes bacterium]|nr:glutaredoxin family protein [Candidatus Fermentithermobacillaceae bacterium]